MTINQVAATHSILFATLSFKCLVACLVGLTVNVASANPAPTSVLAICKDFGCKTTITITLSASDWQQIESPFTRKISSAEQERAAVAVAIGIFERVVGPLAGTVQEKGGNLEGYGLPGQMDCIDESINTTTYLRALEQRRLLRWHKTGERAYRRPFILDQHWSATIVLKDDSQRWAVDSWFLDNGKQPYVQALDKWYDKAEFSGNPDAVSRKKPKRIVTSSR